MSRGAVKGETQAAGAETGRDDNGLDVRLFRRHLRLSEPWIEFLGALLLSLATFIAAWSAYQAAGWASEGSSLTTTLNGQRGEASELRNNALQLRAIDVGMFLQFAEAYSEGNDQLSDFVLDRFRPEMRRAVDAWTATRPLVNPSAPASPFEMEEYSLLQERQAADVAARAEQTLNSVQEASRRASHYVLIGTITVAVLFLGGVGARFPNRAVRRATIAVGWMVVLAVLGYMIAFTRTLGPLPA